MDRILRTSFQLLLLVSLQLIASMGQASNSPYDSFDCGIELSSGVQSSTEFREQTRQVAAKALSAFIGKPVALKMLEQTDPGLGLVEAYLVTDRKISPRPIGLSPGVKAYWGVNLSNPSHVLMIIDSSDEQLSAASLSFTLSFGQHGTSPEKKHLFTALQNLKHGLTIEGRVENRVWSLQFSTLRGYFAALKIIKKLPRNLVRRVEPGVLLNLL